MRIVILNGSPRKNGTTAKILKEFQKKLSSYNGVEIIYVDISELSIDSCKGCCACYKRGRCFIRDDAEKLSNQIGCADGVIIGSPTYASNISGILKNFVDRGHFVIEQLLHNKYAISVATGENYGSKDTGKILNKLLKYSGARLSGSIVLNVPFNGNPLDNKRIAGKVEKISAKMYADIQSDKVYLWQDIFRKLIFNIGIKPFVFKKADEYEGVMHRWRRQGLIG